MSSPQRSAVFASRADLVTTLVVAGLAVVYIVVALVARLAQILPNRDVPVLVSASQEAPFPLGPGGAPVTASIGGAVVPVGDMPPVVLASVAGTAIVPAVAALTIIACATVLLVNLLRGRFFSRVNTALIATISLVIAAAWLVNLVLQTMASNGAVATLSDSSLDAVSFRLDFTLVLVAMGVGCLGAAFRAGERMQRDTDGLV